MIRDLFIPLAELLFWFTDGEPLLNTLWFFVWVIGGAVIIASPMWLSFYLLRQNNRLAWVPGTVFVVTFFPALLVIVLPGIIQNDLIKECLPVQTVIVDTDLVDDVKVDIRHCRAKDNYYDENYGPWEAFTAR